MRVARIFRALLLAGALFISGCASQVSSFQNSIDQYASSPNASSLKELKDEMHDSYMLTFYKTTQADQIVKINALTERAMVILAKNEEWGALSDTIKKSFSSRDINSVGLILIDRYSGSDPVLLEVMGWTALSLERHHDAYRYFESSAFSDKLKAALPRGLAYHYGCKELYDMWGTVIRSKGYFEGDPIPMSDKKLRDWELSDAQTNIQMGKPISIPQSCEILSKA